MKDLRDRFAAQLLTSGVPLSYVSKQLGHADLAVTARHYAKWCEGDGYRRPLTVREGEVPALGGTDRHRGPLHPIRRLIEAGVALAA